MAKLLAFTYWNLRMQTTNRSIATKQTWYQLICITLPIQNITGKDGKSLEIFQTFLAFWLMKTATNAPRVIKFFATFLARKFVEKKYAQTALLIQRKVKKGCKGCSKNAPRNSQLKKILKTKDALETETVSN